MSRIGKQPISVPEGVKVSKDAGLVSVTGPKGNLSFEVHPDMEVKQENSHLLVERPSDNKAHRSLHGTTRAIISNMVQGVTEGFTKELEINGVGYTANLEGKRLKLTLGFSHDIYFEPPEGIEIKAAKNSISVSGINKNLLERLLPKSDHFAHLNLTKARGSAM